MSRLEATRVNRCIVHIGVTPLVLEQFDIGYLSYHCFALFQVPNSPGGPLCMKGLQLANEGCGKFLRWICVGDFLSVPSQHQAVTGTLLLMRLARLDMMNISCTSILFHTVRVSSGPLDIVGSTSEGSGWLLL